MNTSMNLRPKVEFFAKSPYYELYRTIIKDKVSQSSLIKKRTVVLKRSNTISINYWFQISVAITSINPTHNVSEMIVGYVSNKCNIILRQLLKITSSIDRFTFSEVVRLYLDQNQDDFFLYHSTRVYKALISHPIQLFKMYFSRNIFLNLFSNDSKSNRSSIKKSTKKINSSQDDSINSIRNIGKNYYNNSITNHKQLDSKLNSIDARTVPKLFHSNVYLSDKDKGKNDCSCIENLKVFPVMKVKSSNSLRNKRNAIQLRSNSLNSIFSKQSTLKNNSSLNQKKSDRVLNSSFQ